jgi:CMP-N,N'-diacetyllegionaminic acid synthase
LNKTWYIIPARMGSKGLPKKNRILFKETANIIPDGIKDSVVVSSDDIEILKISSEYGFISHQRSAELASDTASIRDVLSKVILDLNISSESTIVLLYLTYPTRTWANVEDAICFFNKHNGVSLLCKKQIHTSPYLMFFEEESLTGTKVIDHDLCRRQDYRNCFEVSHFIGVFNSDQINILDTNLWNKDTIFMPIDNKIDVDYKKDLDLFNLGDNLASKNNS